MPGAASNTGGIRSVSQTVQEREIVKTAPDIVVYFEGLPYLINDYMPDPQTGLGFTLVNFNDHVSSFNAAYDTDQMVPTSSVNLQVPNHMRYLYQMPGGNNLIATMMQVQVYCKGYFMSSAGDTVYRRVFKGVTSHIGYNDNGRTLEISIQCHGSLYMLDLMKMNINPSAQSSIVNGSKMTIQQAIFADNNPYRVIADAFVVGLQSDAFQLDTYFQVGPTHGRFRESVERGYIAKWQAILVNMCKDVHVFGSAYKDDPNRVSGPDKTVTGKDSPIKGQMDLDTLAGALSRFAPAGPAEDVADFTYYSQIGQFHPWYSITALNPINNHIVTRLELIRRMVQLIGFEGYQDLDGKIIVKPPLYNLDVLYLGPRTSQLGTSTTDASKANSQTNPLTEIYPESNPFVVTLAEILEEQETEDQAAILRTRTVVHGAVDPKNKLVDLDTQYMPVAEYIDVGKLAKFGLREEPAYPIPWIGMSDQVGLFATAVMDTVRANRGYRTYTFTIPIRPELKLGFPVFIPHKDMYAYVKTVNINYNVGQTATMTVTCDSVRRRVLVSTRQKTNDPNPTEYTAWVTAPDLVYVWAYDPPGPSTLPNQGVSANADLAGLGQTEGLVSGGPKASNVASNGSQQVGSPASVPNTAKSTQPSKQQVIVHSYYTQELANVIVSPSDTATTSWVVQNDGDPSGHTVSPQSGQPYYKRPLGQGRIADYPLSLIHI